MRVVQADPPGGAIGSDPGESLPGLRHDLSRRGELFVQGVDRADEPAAAPTGRRVELADLTSGRRADK